MRLAVSRIVALLTPLFPALHKMFLKLAVLLTVAAGEYRIYTNTRTCPYIFRSPKKSKIVTLDFDLDSIYLQYFQEKSKIKPSKTLLNVKGTQITHNIACSVAELDLGGVLILETVLIETVLILE
jgi:hypothetical protein